MNREKPDMLRQSDGFERVHENLTVALIATRRDGDEDRPGVRTCRVGDSLAQVRANNINPTFDYLPVEAPSGDIVGLFHAKSYQDATEGGEQTRVDQHMCPLSEADLISADTSIFDFISRVRPKPLLVVSKGKIDGLVAWSDLQKLPVRAAVFALVTGFELTMYEAIKTTCREGHRWREYLSDSRLQGAEALYKQRGGNESDVELLLCTEFCDKRTILKKCLSFDPEVSESGSLPMSKRKFESDVSRIEELRNPLAHASNYAMSWEEVEGIRETGRILVELRKRIKHSVDVSARGSAPSGAR